MRSDKDEDFPSDLYGLLKRERNGQERRVGNPNSFIALKKPPATKSRRVAVMRGRTNGRNGCPIGRLVGARWFRVPCP